MVQLGFQGKLRVSTGFGVRSVPHEGEEEVLAEREQALCHARATLHLREPQVRVEGAIDREKEGWREGGRARKRQ
jgi:hypothetical protein